MPSRIALFIIIIFLAACRQPTEPSHPGTSGEPDSTAGMIVADTIIYDVLISNPDPTDPWAIRSLGRLNRKAMIDSIFSMVYTQRAVAYNHETNERLTLKQVRQIEAAEGFSRDNIGMIQFTESWYLNAGANTMTKKVISLILGYNFYSSDGELFGHKPVFRIEMRRD